MEGARQRRTVKTEHHALLGVTARDTIAWGIAT